MEEPLVASTSQKRPREDDADPQPSTPAKAISSEASSPLSPVASIQTPSPMKTSQPNASASTPNNDNDPSTQATPSAQQPAKRRRFTEKEKQEQKLEKEAKAKAIAERKAQREAKDKLKAEKKAQKEEEEKAKAEEKAKKERSQMRLNAFFGKPKAPSGGTEQSMVESNQTSTTPSTSLLPDTAGTVTDSAPPSPQKSIQKSAQSDYERCFLPFALPSHATLAPKNAFMKDADKTEAARSRLDEIFAKPSGAIEPMTLETLKVMLPARSRRGAKNVTVADVVERIHGSSNNPVDLTDDTDAARDSSLKMLQTMSMKYLHFGEDVRPPYYGTYTKPYSALEASRLARNSVSRVRQDTNYEYDSEAEWEEPEEGEDLDSEGEDDAEEDADDDMDGFLDDEEDPQLKRRLLSGDLVPVSTGLCWEDADGVSRLNDGSGAISTDFKEFKMGFLLEQAPQSIDPFSVAYWTPEPAPPTVPTTVKKDTLSNGLMQPPRAPLTHRTMNGLLNTMNGSQAPTTATTPKNTPPKRLVPDDQMAAFKAEIQGKDLTKIGMIEALKKAFPKLPKQMITQTLSTVAARVGPTEKEKRWVLINP